MLKTTWSCLSQHAQQDDLNCHYNNTYWSTNKVIFETVMFKSHNKSVKRQSNTQTDRQCGSYKTLYLQIM